MLICGSENQSANGGILTKNAAGLRAFHERISGYLKAVQVARV
ncbi:hypothetical protein HMPREF9371_2003 [Neisseria shayeganii 871]|uniref:Uncharacterized protein n=1 Tax=Neisseria shayeganii 871 TaxID=1032488 RepID=G4CK63_9NEIS|nr:hypothetical protein HMPREF9371_2003 [Neisseria shayeganii 871]